MLKRLRLKLAHNLTNFFIADAIAQTNVHRNSRLIYAQILNENGYDYNRPFAHYPPQRTI
ncbi:hypothetical protein UUU_39410 [Klebsiella pneumoniae subsp. pneumoniae DSM 30104 = JCM 1662 = NBRC 14940]|nr:hypothetical protein UUU_39410 [Klebsiella pneumoniae subsp. pneumoniae DSM 30104 = JCM 1662 = NBRC 14940]